jgi:hypothetical protein
MGLNPEQRRVAAGMAAAATFAVVFVLVGSALAPFPPPRAETIGERLGYALRCDVFAALALFAGIARVAALRFFDDEVDGTAAPRSHALEVHRAYIQNTLEQLVLLLAAHLGFAASEPAERLPLLPLLVTLFLIGRAAFWIGYLHSPPSRAFGFAATFYPTLVLLLYTAARIAGGG